MPLSLPEFHQRARMRNPGGQPQQHRRIKLFGQRICQLGIIPALSGITRLEHRHLRRNRMMAGVLLILRGMHAGIVGHRDHQAAVDADIRRGIQRVGRHVQPDVLHCAEAARAAGAGAVRHLKRHLFVRRPLGIDVLFILYHAFGDLGARGARIGGHHPHAGFIQPAGHRFISQQHCFQIHLSFLPQVFRPHRPRQVFWSRRSSTRLALPVKRSSDFGSTRLTLISMPRIARIRSWICRRSVSSSA